MRIYLFVPFIGLFSACTKMSEMLNPTPNVVVIVVDTLRADRVGSYGHTRPTTPNIDRWAEEGVLFEKAYAHSGWTLPSTVSMITGLYPHEHRVGRSPKKSTEFGSLPKEQITLAEVFQNAQYQTMAVVNNTFLAPDFGLSQGFNEYDYRGADNQDIRTSKESCDVALTWWTKTEGPKMMFWHVMEPHLDLIPPESSRGRFVKDPTVDVPFGFEQASIITKTPPKERDQQKIMDVLALYDEEILSVDQQVGRLVDGIGTDNTIFVLTSDHGEEFWEHNGFEHGHHLKSVLTQVPLIFWGAKIPKGQRESELVSHVDMFRTILQLVDLEPPEKSHGAMIIGEVLPKNRMVLSENTLYGDPMLSVVSSTHRIEMNQDSKMAALWEIDQYGREKSLLEENLDVLAQPLFNYIGKIRGSVDPIDQVSGLNLPSRDAFQNLKKLGYIDEDR